MVWSTDYQGPVTGRRLSQRVDQKTGADHSPEDHPYSWTSFGGQVNLPRAATLGTCDPGTDVFDEVRSCHQAVGVGDPDARVGDCRSPCVLPAEIVERFYRLETKIAASFPR